MNNNILIGLGVIVAVFIFWYWYTNTYDMYNYAPLPAEEDKSRYEPYENPTPRGEQFPVNNPAEPTGKPTDVEAMTNNTCYPKDQLTPEELLPQDFSSTWAKCNPAGAGTLEGKNFLDAGWNIGINTVGQTLRNANLQLRSEPPNPQIQVSPFLNTSIQPDTNRRYFEISEC